MGAEDNLRIAPNAYGLEFNENEVPACQGCKKNEAQFVCAGCANQLYCSRECQVSRFSFSRLFDNKMTFKVLWVSSSGA